MPNRRNQAFLRTLHPKTQDVMRRVLKRARIQMVALPTITIETRSPCCNRLVRVVALVDVPRETYTKRCGSCGKVWEVERRFVRETEGRRVDLLEWTAAASGGAK